ncbi:MAG: hypothetical protein ACUVTZ_09120 [Armatimonadota bacterium]
MNEHVRIEVAGLAVQVHCRDAEFLAQIADRYEGFLQETSDSAAEYCFALRTDEALPAGSEMSPSVATGPGWYRLVRRDFEVDVVPHERKMHGIVARNLYSFDSVLRVFFSVALLELDGLLLHSCAAVEGARAFAFFGVSGAGKTTTARLSLPQHPVLSDELTVIRQVNGEQRAFGTPFWGEMQKNGANVWARLGALMQLVKDTETRLVPLRPVPALQRLLPCVLFFARQEELVQRAVDICCRLVQDVPVYEMHFLPDASFWRLIKDVP